MLIFDIYTGIAFYFTRLWPTVRTVGLLRNDGGEHNRDFRRAWVSSSVSSKGWLRSAVIEKKQNCQKVLPCVPQSRHASLVGWSFDGFISGLLVRWLTGVGYLAWV